MPDVVVIKRIVCLANSRKLHGRCIAGRELIEGRPGDWIRPVSDRENEEVSEYERQYEDGGDPRVLDIIDVPLIGRRAKSYQRENWLLDPDRYWMKVGEFGRDRLGELSDSPGPIFLNGYRTFNGTNDCLPLEEAGQVVGSLKLIALDQGVRLHVNKAGEVFGNPKRRVQADFSFGGVRYCLWVTDPLIESTYLAKANGSYDVGPCYLTISLSEPFKGRCYKLVAAIIGARP
jgi:hypothetical protein